jgi:hypothetical protein
VRLGEIGGKPVPAACRFEVVRPDGVIVTRDWDKKAFQLNATHPGIWSWTMYVRHGGATVAETGRFEVTSGRGDVAAPRIVGRIGQLVRRFGGKSQR